MDLSSFIIYFITGGLFTTIIVVLEENNNRLLSGFATLIPVFTLVAYLFIGQSKGGIAVGQHAWFVLFGTIVSWIPYMIAVAYLSPRIGPHKAILVGLGVFFVLALLYLLAVSHFRLFR
ncbi:GlpM family protein [Patescibacteria group bacterium]|nr:GlpM family protein [Patescibacteria group bacterium]